MLKLAGADGAELSLEILGYEFPEIETGEDAEWLLISAVVKCPEGNWKFRAPCLETVDLPPLAAWFKETKLGGPHREIGFIEPAISFEQVTGGHSVKALFSHEGAPPWYLGEERCGKLFELEFLIELNDFGAIAINLENVARKYPIRTKEFRSRVA
jgi:hypothetical protein